MKKSIYLILLLAGLCSGCKKEKDPEIGPKPEPETENPTKAGEFLKGLTVTGAQQITFDSTSKSYMVSLPDTYSEEQAEVKLSLHSNIGLVNQSGEITKDSIIRFAYRGVGPLVFELREKANRGNFFFNVYFNFSGKPNITLLSKELPISSLGIIFPLRFEAKMGSIPSSPNQAGPILRITNPKTGFSTETVVYDIEGQIGLEKAETLLTSDLHRLEILFYNQEPVVFEGIKFIRDAPVVTVWPSYKFQYTRKDTISANGGIFIPQEKYTVTFSSDFLEKPVTAAMRVNDHSKISLDKIPANLEEGAYLVSFYEKDKLIGKSSVYLGNFETNCLETIWKGSIEKTLERNTLPLLLNKGDIFYAKSQPLDYGSGSTDFDVNRLPRLRLKSAAKTVDLAPELIVFNWLIAGFSYSLGKYKIPADLPAGKYTVTGVYTNRYESKPYWSKMEVK
ncbi:hypothetical protein [Dyadobacter crusticola]|uniref:hypothetical protein n=1 Tax=Dyadobacter crusticola TaxID=292407 RepID=UPI0004E1FD4A|nr:hypothetical protein [Dyadobacter crusticola]